MSSNRKFKRWFSYYIVVFSVLKNWRITHIGNQVGSTAAGDADLVLTGCQVSNLRAVLYHCRPGHLADYNGFPVLAALVLLGFNMVAEVEGGRLVPLGPRAACYSEAWACTSWGRWCSGLSAEGAEFPHSGDVSLSDDW